MPSHLVTHQHKTTTHPGTRLIAPSRIDYPPPAVSSRLSPGRLPCTTPFSAHPGRLPDSCHPNSPRTAPTSQSPAIRHAPPRLATPPRRRALQHIPRRQPCPAQRCSVPSCPHRLPDAPRSWASLPATTHPPSPALPNSRRLPYSTRYFPAPFDMPSPVTPYRPRPTALDHPLLPTPGRPTALPETLPRRPVPTDCPTQLAASPPRSTTQPWPPRSALPGPRRLPSSPLPSPPSSARLAPTARPRSAQPALADYP